jgi:hypothetical protein
MPRPARRKLPSTALAGVLFLFAFAPPTSAQDASVGSKASFSFERDPASLVVRFRETFGELSGAGPGPSLELFGDGRVAIQFPPYMKDAGRYRVQLTPGEMQALVASLVGHGLTDLDENALRERRRALVAERRAAAQRSGESELFDVSDRSVVEIELRVVPEASGSAASPSGGGGPLTRRIVWPGLRSDAKRFPEWREIQGLAAAHRELRALMTSPARVQDP